MLSGSLAGCLAYTSVYPIDYTRCMISINKVPNNVKFWQTFNYLRKRDGFLKMYRGLSACLIGTFPYCGLKFYFFEYLQRITRKIAKKDSLGKIENLACGSGAGILACSITYPMDIMRKRR